MKLTALLSVVILLSALTFGQDPCPNWRPIDPNTCPFPIDKTKIVGTYIGSMESFTRSRVVINAPTCDPEGMGMTATGVSVPVGMIVTADANSYLQLEWTPTLSQAGTHYVTIKVTDVAPAAGLQPASITATMVWRVVAKNEPPQIGGCRAL